MIWMRVVVGILVCWAGSAAAATLTWNENTEGNLAGYRVYHCTVIPCTPSSGNQSLLVNLGKVTSYNIGTPSSTKHYYVTAIDTSNAESASSGVVTYSPSSMPAVSNLTLTVVGTPTQGKWGVEAATTDLRDVMATVYLDGKMYLTDN
jgi:hypothetical protein